jgi:4-hydroxy-tetrahydrodipicolinate synthase
MSAKLTSDAKGLYVIAATPFHDDGRIDFDSIDSLVDFYVRCGAQGITILGVMGEYQKLSESETIEVSQRFIKRAAGRVPIIVGVSNPGTYPLVKTARAVMEMGAAGVMVMPTPGLTTDQAVENYMRSILTALGPSIPVCVQDYPKLTGVYFTADTFLRLVDAFPQIAMFKHEDMPGLSKLSAIRNACNGKGGRRYVSILCGNGGIHLPQEYLRGADGAMTGFAFPDMMVRMHKLFAAGKPDEGEDLYDLYLPLMRHELQPGVGLPLRKEILRRRGAIRSAAIRAPGPKLDATDMAELDRLLARLAKKTGLGLNDFQKP